MLDQVMKIVEGKMWAVQNKFG